MHSHDSACLSCSSRQIVVFPHLPSLLLPSPLLLSRFDLRFNLGLLSSYEFFPDYSVSSLMSAVPSASIASVTTVSVARGCRDHPALQLLEGPHAVLYSLLHPTPDPYPCQAQNQTHSFQ